MPPGADSDKRLDRRGGLPRQGRLVAVGGPQRGDGLVCEGVVPIVRLRSANGPQSTLSWANSNRHLASRLCGWFSHPEILLRQPHRAERPCARGFGLSRPSTATVAAGDPVLAATLLVKRL